MWPALLGETVRLYCPFCGTELYIKWNKVGYCYVLCPRCHYYKQAWDVTSLRMRVMEDYGASMRRRWERARKERARARRRR